MKNIPIKKIYNKIRFFGRTLYDKNSGCFFFNWSGSGFEIEFEGTRLDVCLQAIETFFPREGTLWPWISVFIDNQNTPKYEIEINTHNKCINLFLSDTPEKHKIKVIKRSENDNGKIGIIGFDLEGEVLQRTEKEKKYLIEFIGDSITCGFGNEAERRDNLFDSREENGLLAYSSIVSKELNAEYQSICVSGISLCKPLDKDFRWINPEVPDLTIEVRAMEDYYEYTDRLYEEAQGIKKNFSKWDFRSFTPNFIVINLGTNDSYRIQQADDKAAEEKHFELRYKEFIHTMRKHNGNEPIICCTLGPMNYYLYNNILNAVEEYKNESGDRRILCYKFESINPINEGYGAQDHPSVKTHERMAKELVRLFNLDLI